ncbi:MAG: hypothetical protein HYR68_05925 [Burkholderiales bacterium]|nr:hypothetical protein [Burkholderiales bacterium]
MDSSKWFYSIFTNPIVLELLLGVLNEEGDAWRKTMTSEFFLRKAVGSVCTILFNKALIAFIAKPLVARVAGAQVAQSAPVAGWVMKIMCLTAASGMIISTTVAAQNAPSLYKLQLNRAIDVHVNFQSGASQKLGPFPRKDASSPIKHHFGNVPAGELENIQVTANLYSKNEWLCGAWVSDWMKAVSPDGSSILKLTGTIVERLVPLASDTSYLHKKKLAFQNGKRIWQETVTAPTEVWSSRKKDPDHYVSKLVNLTSNNHAYRIGYTWMANGMGLPLDNDTTPVNSQMYTFQCISTLADPEKGSKLAGRGFSVQPSVAFDQFGPQALLTLPLTMMNELDSATTAVSAEIRNSFTNAGKPLPQKAYKKQLTKTLEWWIGEEGKTDYLYVLKRRPASIDVYAYPNPEFSSRNFYLDPRGSQDKKLHLRHVDLADSSKEFNYESNQSWGVFNQSNLDAVIIHPRGYAIGVRTAAS